MDIYLHPDLNENYPNKAEAFKALMNLQGKSYRALEGRQTQRVQLGEQIYFIKQHRGIGWREIIKNILQMRLPVLSARNEWRAIQRLQKVGIATAQIAAYGCKGINPAKQHSFILLGAIEPAISLEALTHNWSRQPPTFQSKHVLLKAVAEIAKTMHASGVNHRDFYLCHFLLPEKYAKQIHTPMLYLIDLHRAQCRTKVPLRWRIKDIAGLYFSSKDCGLTQRDLLRFMRYYCAQPLKDILHKERNFWESVKQRGEQLYREHI